jgi:hypothetical protein
MGLLLEKEASIVVAGDRCTFFFANWNTRYSCYAIASSFCGTPFRFASPCYSSPPEISLQSAHGSISKQCYGLHHTSQLKNVRARLPTMHELTAHQASVPRVRALWVQLDCERKLRMCIIGWIRLAMRRHLVLTP